MTRIVTRNLIKIVTMTDTFIIIAKQSLPMDCHNNCERIVIYGDLLDRDNDRYCGL